MNVHRWQTPPVFAPRPGVAEGSGGGRIKALPEDFEVVEIPKYLPSGQGDHLYLFVEKTDIASPVFAREAARRLRIPRREIGLAGMKDRRAVTRQWISVPAKLDVPVEAIEGPLAERGMIRLLEASRHTNRLKTGHLVGNRFKVRIRERDPAQDSSLVAALDGLAAAGFVNCYGAQRFLGDDLITRGLAMLGGQTSGPSGAKRLAISVTQASFFNHWAAARVSDALVDTVLAGDVVQKRHSGGVFVSDDPAVDGRRLAAGELVVTGPMPGSKPSRARDQALAREIALCRQLGVDPGAFQHFGRLGRGTRRPLLAWPSDVAMERDDEGVVVTFTLPRGAYASVLLQATCGEGLDVGRSAPA